MKIPKGVNLNLSGRRFPSLSFLLFIVFSFRTENILSCLPGLFWVKNGFSRKLIAMAIMANRSIGETTNNPSKERKKSKGLLKYFLYMLRLFVVGSNCLFWPKYNPGPFGNNGNPYERSRDT